MADSASNDFVIPSSSTLADSGSPSRSSPRRSGLHSRAGSDDGIERQVKALYERKRMAQLIAAKKKVSAIRDPR